jgi:tripartite ATP-independent transporter DctM subunit
MVLLPLLEAGVLRTLNLIPMDSGPWVRHLTLWVGLAGAVLASAGDRHFTIALKEVIGSRRGRGALELLARGGTLGILLALALASMLLVLGLRGFPSEIGAFLPLSWAVAPLPVAFAVMGWHALWKPDEAWSRRATVLLAAAVGSLVVLLLSQWGGRAFPLVGISGLMALALAGAPLFVVLGGAALVLFSSAGVPIAAVVDASYQITTKPTLPSIPLFALAGVVLARGGAPERLLRLVRAWIGWIPGGASVATIIGCAFFTAITGASGVTILALGALLLPILLAAGHGREFSLGLLTASGSVGLLFPPSVPVILCAVYGGIGLDHLFAAALLPGLLLLLILAIFCLRRGAAHDCGRPSFEIREAAEATRRAWGDLLLPFLVVAAFFGGVMTPVETAALAALWAMVLEVGIHRSLDVGRGLVGAMKEAALLVGALIVVIGLAQSLFSFLVDAQVPLVAAEWIQTVIESRWVFLLALNVVLLVVGAFMDIYSAIVVIVPLLLPMAGVYGIHPAHLGVIFLTNMELGYLTPPVGLNLFLSSATFERPILEIWRAVIPFLFLLGIWVLLVTYVPALSVGFASRVLG